MSSLISTLNWHAFSSLLSFQVDIREKEDFRQCLATYRPHIVFHVASYGMSGREMVRNTTPSDAVGLKNWREKIEEENEKNWREKIEEENESREWAIKNRTAHCPASSTFPSNFSAFFPSNFKIEIPWHVFLEKISILKFFLNFISTSVRSWSKGIQASFSPFILRTFILLTNFKEPSSINEKELILNWIYGTKQCPWVETEAFPWRVGGDKFYLRFFYWCAFGPCGLPLFQLGLFAVCMWNSNSY